ncbi:MAG TPA: hypothetical protein VHH73_10745 [Verrucomicrobiae bacterium]|nr:hypothetical protein [Verrucomicrobiae bacterium]
MTTPANGAKIMIIRHAEKPPDNPPPHGVTFDGDHDKESLTVLGWQRAGALASFFAPASGVFANPQLATPKLLYASGTHGSKSLRPIETITPLSQKLGAAFPINTKFSKGQETQLAGEIVGLNGPVLVAWQHELIPAIANAIAGNSITVPQNWPDKRFDLVWVFNFSAGSGWSFAQVPQMLLAGDLPSIIQ